MADVFPDVGQLDGISGNSVQLVIDGVPVYALQNFNWEISKDKKPLHGCGFKRAHGITESAHKTYSIDFEVKEVLAASALNVAQLAKNEAAGAGGFADGTDIRDAIIILLYPGAASTRSKIFKGVNITKVSGGVEGGEDANPVGMKFEGFATDADGLF